MYIDRRLVGFGAFLITIGVVVVAVRQNVLDDTVARQAWALWPLILVGVGLSLVLAGRPGSLIGGLLIWVTIGAMLGGFAASGAFPGGGLCVASGGSSAPFGGTSGDLPSSGQVTIAQDCGDLAIGTVAGSTWSLSGDSRDGRAPRVDASLAILRIAARSGEPFDLGGSSAWTVAVPRDPTLNLAVQINGGSGRIGLAGANLVGLSIEANAGSIDLDLRDIGSIGDATVEVNFGSAVVRLPTRPLTLRLAANAGSAVICRPTGVGLRVLIDSVAAATDLADHGLVPTSGGWETPDYASAGIRIEVRAAINAGSLSLDPSRQCAG